MQNVSQIKTFSPVAVFCYKRPEHTRKVLKALSECVGIENTEVFIFRDGPKSEADAASTNEVLTVINNFNAALKTHHFIADKNIGLNSSIESGIAEVFKRHKTVIVLEDDIIVSNSFLTYMNNAFETFKNEKSVFHISGYTPNMNLNNHKQDIFFLRSAQIWGWGTWSDRWQHYFRDPKLNYDLISQSKRETARYNFSESIKYFSLLKKTINGDQTIWDTKWSSSVFVLKGLALYPVNSLTKNIGLDSSGEHCESNAADYFQPNNFRTDNPAPSLNVSSEIKENKSYKRKMQLFMAKQLGRRAYYTTWIKSLFNAI